MGRSNPQQKPKEQPAGDQIHKTRELPRSCSSRAARRHHLLTPDSADVDPRKSWPARSATRHVLNAACQLKSQKFFNQRCQASASRFPRGLRLTTSSKEPGGGERRSWDLRIDWPDVQQVYGAALVGTELARRPVDLAAGLAATLDRILEECFRLRQKVVPRSTTCSARRPRGRALQLAHPRGEMNHDNLAVSRATTSRRLSASSTRAVNQ
jgi:hypothetical protein